MAENKAVDWTLAVSLANGSEDTAKQLLQLLIQQLPDNKTDSQHYYTNRDYKSLRDLVHKVHGASCYCGVPLLKNAAREFEEALRNGRTDVFDPLYSQFIGAIGDVQTQAVEIISDEISC